MKGTILFFILCATIGTISTINAQSSKSSGASSTTEGYFLRNGFLMYANNGTVSQMPTEQVLGNGSVISIYGKITDLNGSSTDLNPGELLGSDGVKSAKKVEEFIAITKGQAFVVTNDILTPVEEGLKVSGGLIVNRDGTTNSAIRLTEGKKMDFQGKMTASGVSGN